MKRIDNFSRIRSVIRKNRILYACLLSLIAAMLSIVSCDEGTKVQSTDTGDSTGVAIVRPDQQIRNARISMYDGARKTTDVQADYIEKFEKNDSTLAWNLKVDFFDTAGHVISDLVADSGVVREKVNFMEVFGHVVVTTEDSAILLTEQLKHNTRDDKIETDKFVRIIQHGDTIQGYGLEADRQLKNIRIKKQVSGTLKGTEDVLE